MNLNFPETFESLLDVCTYFTDEKVCHQFLAQQLWQGYPTCPHCGVSKAYKFSDGKRYKCSKCRKQFTATVGTIFEQSNLPLRKWFMAIYLVGINKKGVTGSALSRAIKVTPRTAWFMLHRIRKLMSQDSEGKLMGVIQMDETFVGGKNKNRHKDKKVDFSQDREYPDKAPVVGMLADSGELRAVVTKTVRNTAIHPVIYNNIAKGSIIATDDWHGYMGVENDYDRHKVEHSKGKFLSDTGFTTNGIESFWSQLKRCIIGVHHQVSKKHLQRYVDEMVFKHNYRKHKTGFTFALLISRIANRRLTYKNLVHG